MKLNELKIGQCARITSVGGEGALRQHFLDMGVIPGVSVTVVKLAPMGDPMELRIHGYELTLRLAEAAEIEIEPIEKRSRSHERISVRIIPRGSGVRCTISSTSASPISLTATVRQGALT